MKALNWKNFIKTHPEFISIPHRDIGNSTIEKRKNFTIQKGNLSFYYSTFFCKGNNFWAGCVYVSGLSLEDRNFFWVVADSENGARVKIKQAVTRRHFKEFS